MKTSLCHREAAEGHFLTRLARVTVDKLDGKAPAAIQLFPSGPNLGTVDGRQFTLSDPARIIAAFEASGRPLLIDYDHRSHFAPDAGGSDRAAGWITSLKIVGGQVWGVVEWTSSGAAAIEASEYRYISPEFTTDPASGEVEAIIAAALVNRPAFVMTALARREAGQGAVADPSKPTVKIKEDTNMLSEIAKALGLPEGAAAFDMLAAIAARDEAARTALASAERAAQTPSLDRFVPRADYDATLARASALEAELTAIRKQARDGEVEAIIAGAIKAGKIAPASKDHYIALASSDEGLAQVKALVATLPPVIDAAALRDHPVLPGGSQGGLDADQRQLCRVMGIPEAEFQKTLAERASA